jgi:hypothetical protein
MACRASKSYNKISEGPVLFAVQKSLQQDNGEYE